ncbi:hypothetical protein BS47DRAFT_1346691 [Hydnum rufescens UP504]|uniref:Uncharacterized protein n=1 Tax=Hydnum rufescens UP504 TaxID=1448309 RepID=A0A9P6ATC8_9AGAM|nr:hypothetical protein BS47DRAFT_1346691 [Hydnum rufescens UP504]
MMRDAAYAAGLVAPEGSQEYAGGRDRLHIISEPEAGAVHCVLWKDLGLKPNQSFMVCDAGGGTIDTAIYQIFREWNVTQIAERCASSGASCGSHFLDINFRAYLEQWHQTRNIPLSSENLARYMHAFTYTQKLGRHLYFECFDVSDYYNTDLSDDEFFNGQLVVPVSDLQERVFDPSSGPIQNSCHIFQVLGVLEAQLKRVGSVNALLLETFHERLHGRILNPMDPDIATSLGTAQSGLAESLIQRPIGAPTIIASKSYIIGIGPNIAIGRRGNWKLRTAAGMMNGFNGVSEAQYLVGEPVLQEFTKTSSNPSDSVFVARVYTSDSAEMRADTSGGDLEHIVDWEIDLSDIPLFKRNVQNSPRKRFDTEAHVVWLSDGERGGRLRLPGIPGN